MQHNIRNPLYVQGGVSRADIKQGCEAGTGRPKTRDLEEMREIAVRGFGHVVGDHGREPTSKLFGFARCESVDPQYCPSGVIRPVPRSWIYLPVDIETRVKGGGDQIIGRFNAALKPPDHSSKSDSGIKRLWVGNVSENP